MNFYKSKQWEAVARNVRTRDQYLCQQCLRIGRRREGKEVHHVNPLRERPDLQLDQRNLITLCQSCHNRMEDRASGRLSGEGEKMRKRINRKNGIADRT